jgi:hypothetical protein
MQLRSIFLSSLVLFFLASCAPSIRSETPESGRLESLVSSETKQVPTPDATVSLQPTQSIPRPETIVTVKDFVPTPTDVSVAELPFLETTPPVNVTPKVDVSVTRKLRPEGTPIATQTEII